MFNYVERHYFPQSFIPEVNSDHKGATMLFLQGPDSPLSQVLEVRIKF